MATATTGALNPTASPGPPAFDPTQGPWASLGTGGSGKKYLTYLNNLSSGMPHAKAAKAAGLGTLFQGTEWQAKDWYNKLQKAHANDPAWAPFFQHYNATAYPTMAAVRRENEVTNDRQKAQSNLGLDAAATLFTAGALGAFDGLGGAAGAGTGAAGTAAGTSAADQAAISSLMAGTDAPAIAAGSVGMGFDPVAAAAGTAGTAAGGATPGFSDTPSLVGSQAGDAATATTGAGTAASGAGTVASTSAKAAPSLISKIPGIGPILSDLGISGTDLAKLGIGVLGAGDAQKAGNAASKQLNALVKPASAAEQKMLNQFNSGQLTAGDAATVQAFKDSNYARIKQEMASAGLGTSTALDSALQTVDTQVVAMQQQMLDNYFKEGISALGAVSGPTQAAITAQLNADKQAQEALANAFASIFSSDTGSTVDIPAASNV